jgi:hypothetical protein
VNLLEGVEAEAGPLLIRAFAIPCARPGVCNCGGIVTLVASVPEFGLDRWALIGDHAPPALSLETYREEYSDPDEQEAAQLFVAGFGVPWAVLDERLLSGQRKLWDVPEVKEWLAMPGTTCEQLLTLRRYTGERPSQASRAIMLMADYRRCVQ